MNCNNMEEAVIVDMKFHSLNVVTRKVRVSAGFSLDSEGFFSQLQFTADGIAALLVYKDNYCKTDSCCKEHLVICAHQ